MSDRDTQAAAPAADEPLTRRQKFRLVGLVILKRVRFIAILAAVGLFIGYWDTVMNYWDKWTQPRSAAARKLEPGQEFYCPMDPQVVRTTYEPNGDVPKCPICGMPLSLRKKGEAAKLPEGITGRVQLSPERIELAGIKTAAVEYRPMARETKTVGYVAYDESRLSPDCQPRGGLRGEALRGQDFHRWSTRAIRWLKSTARNCTARPRNFFWRPVEEGWGTWPPPPGTSSCCWALASRKSTASWPRASRRFGW